MKYILETCNLTKKYGGVTAVNNVNMHIEKGDIYGFVGENGAGKTTVIRLITGLSLPTSGSYRLFDTDCTDKEFSHVKKAMSGIVESVTINKNMTALENLKLQNILTQMNHSDEELICLLEEVGLHYEEIQSRKAGKFSLGMRQRLGIAVAMVSNPEFIILDEPMNGLDPAGFIDVREIILKLNKQGVTFLISSHILSELDKICNKVGIISKGQLIEEISMDELHQKSRRHIRLTPMNHTFGDYVEGLGLTDYHISEQSLLIYDKIDINDVMKLLVEKGLLIENISLVEVTIEDYYMKAIRRR